MSLGVARTVGNKCYGPISPSVRAGVLFTHSQSPALSPGCRENKGIAAVSSGCRRLRESRSPIQERRTALSLPGHILLVAALSSHLHNRAPRSPGCPIGYIWVQISRALLRLLAHPQKYDSSAKCGYNNFDT
jgi:hypothetical protein